VGRRESGFELRLIAQWAPGDPGADGHRAWLRAAGQRLRAHGTGRVFPTFRTDEGAGAVYGDALPRLIEVKRRYDPDHIFAAL
jgi:FAD/FMN-containing dehydrogenase